MKKLREAEDLQEKTKDSLMRSQRMAEEAEGLGAQTLDELRRQGEQMVIYLLPMYQKLFMRTI